MYNGIFRNRKSEIVIFFVFYALRNAIFYLNTKKNNKFFSLETLAITEFSNRAKIKISVSYCVENVINDTINFVQEMKKVVF
ncbi:hypothetical protein KSI01_02160 [Kurthia sibirica]|uniref:Uncharacterized protein n=1 Tax=Kurthia sibirica TaxID=202750 RepID=A0A2U3AQG3_9BACL|nr:hypothetical protein DEX24_00345 [Kurthia sibirica]GEK32683.1 hypothetical protein KSI01_02160 [Kurthia sibirica]